MKISLYTAAILTAIAMNAKAEVINLSTTSCGAYRNCQAVPNDVEADVAVVSTPVAGPNPGSPPTTIYVNGVAYSGRLATEGNYNFFDADVTADDGSVGHLTAQWHTTVRRVNSGRAHYSITTWWLDYGVFTLP